MAEPKFKDLIYFVVDFDTQKDAVRFFGAQMQSTLIAFKGTTETGRHDVNQPIANPSSLEDI
jgi:thioredoxin 1